MRLVDVALFVCPTLAARLLGPEDGCFGRPFLRAWLEMVGKFTGHCGPHLTTSFMSGPAPPSGNLLSSSSIAAVCQERLLNFHRVRLSRHSKAWPDKVLFVCLNHPL
uniref:Putative secreted protein n=1 Tax=Ixodes ricinus TaxID=34613 RepID=A0A6B0UHQ3_IXORI